MLRFLKECRFSSCERRKSGFYGHLLDALRSFDSWQTPFPGAQLATRIGNSQSTQRTKMTFHELIRRAGHLWKATEGQDLVEYALMAAFVAVAAGSIFPTTIAPNISQIFSKITSTLSLI